MQDSHPDSQAIQRWIAANVVQEIDDVQPIQIKGPEAYIGGKRIYTVHFREYPVARLAPKPMSSRNLFAVESAWLKHYSTRKEWAASFLDLVAKPVSKAEFPKLLKAYLDASKEFSQDGFFKFSIPESRFSLSGNTVAGYAVVDPKGGDRGELRAVLTFEPVREGYKLCKIEEKDTIQPGVRPICQATKLLDRDPIVRKMAERDLLVMGKSARPYLLEQRAKAPPKLKSAIDRIWQRILHGER